MSGSFSGRSASPLTQSQTFSMSSPNPSELRRGACDGAIVPRRGNRYKGGVWNLGVAQVADEEFDGGYKPSEDEIFMNERQREYFRRKLLAWKEEILRESQETLAALQCDSENHPDLADRASSETERS